MEFKFKKLTFEQSADTIMMFLEPEQPNSPWHKWVVEVFPEMDKLGITASEVVKILEKRFANKQEELAQNVEKTLAWWKKGGDEVITQISNLLELKECSKNEILWLGDYCPVYPRNIDDWSFNIPMNISLSKFKKISSHEILHFLWFDKVQELDNVKIYQRDDDSDMVYLKYWYLSEIVVDPILNETEFAKREKIDYKSYDEFYHIDLDGTNLMKTIKSMWENRKDFADFHNKSRDYIFENFSELNEKYTNFHQKLEEKSEKTNSL